MLADVAALLPKAAEVRAVLQRVDPDPGQVVADVDAADTGCGLPASTPIENFPGVESPLIGLPSTSVRPTGATDGCPGRDDFFDADPWVTVTWPR